MQVWQIVLLSYVGALIVWLMVNAVFLLASFIAKHKVFVLLEGITSILNLLLSIATGIGDIALIIWLFSNNQIVWGILAIILGISIVTIAGEILALPFIGITAGFSTWYDSISEGK
jgi:hypothetical protein